MKGLNVMLSAGLVATLFAGTALAQGLPKFFNPPKSKVTINLGANKITGIYLWTIGKYSYFSAINLTEYGATVAQYDWAKAHAEKIFANEPAVFVNEAEFVKKFYHKFHPIMKGPNLAPPLPKGVTMAQWKAAVTEARDNLNSLQNVNWKTGMPGQYSPMATQTQWFNDPSDPFYNKQFPVKDLKDGFVISHKPLVIVSRPKGYGEIDVMQYVGGGNQGTLWLGEQVNKKGYTVDIGYALSSVPNGVTPYFHPYKNLGITVNAIAAQNTIWADGGGSNVVPLPRWNPSWVLTPLNA